MTETMRAASEEAAQADDHSRSERAGLTVGERLSLAGLALFAVSVTAWILEATRHPNLLWSPLDLGVYWEGGLAVRHGPHLYDLNYTWVHLPFTYPPFAGGVFAAAAHLSLPTLKVLIAAVDMLTLVVAAWIGLGARQWSGLSGRLGAAFAIAAAGLWLEPVQQTLFFGQVNIVLMLVILLDLRQKDSRWTKGIGVGLAAGFKLTPAIFIGYLLITRRFRAAAVAVATFAASIGVTWIFMPAESHKYWIGRMFTDARRIGNPGYVGNQSLHGLLNRFVDGGSAEKLYLIPAAVAALAGLALAAWAHRRGDEVLGILITAIAGLLASPISWSHHWVWAVPFAAWLAGQRTFAMALWQRITLCAALFLAFTAWPHRNGAGAPITPTGWLWLVPHAQNTEYHWSIGQHLVGELYTGIGVVALGAFAVVALRQRRTAGLKA